MSETNGQSKSRLDRIEEMIERQERANEAAHALFQEDDKRLLTAQILMNGAMQKTNETVGRLMATVEKTNEAVDKLMVTVEKTNEAAKETAQEFWKAIKTLELKMEETTEKLDALIETVDGIIRKPPDSILPATGH
jgi:hypothetical protein